MVTGDLRTPRIYTWNHRTIYHWSSEFSINKPRSTASNSVNKIDRSNQFWFDRLVVSIPCRAWFKYSARNARNFSGTRFKIFPLPPPPTCFPNGWETNSRTDGPRIINLANSALFHLIQTSPRYIYIYIYKFFSNVEKVARNYTLLIGRFIRTKRMNEKRESATIYRSSHGSNGYFSPRLVLARVAHAWVCCVAGTRARSGVRKLAGHTVDVITGRTPPVNDISVKHAVFW